MTQTNKQMFFCTRPALASELMSKGYEGHETVHPFKAHMLAWTFPLTKQTAEIIKAYYRKVGAPLPKSIQNWEKDGDKK